MICGNCVIGFFHDPLRMGVVAVSLAVALASLFLLMRKEASPGRRVFLIYLHVFGLVFPFAFFLFFNGCSAFFSWCSSLPSILYMIGLAVLLSAIIGSVAAPFLFVYRQSKSSSELNDAGIFEFVRRESGAMCIRCPKVCLVDSAKPVAFSFSNIRPVIFISVGMLELLNAREIEAVLLHELLHIRNGTSLFRFSAFFMRLFSPLSMFASFKQEFDCEEFDADRFACKRQGTVQHIRSAKRKIGTFFRFSGMSK